MSVFRLAGNFNEKHYSHAHCPPRRTSLLLLFIVHLTISAERLLCAALGQVPGATVSKGQHPSALAGLGSVLLQRRWFNPSSLSVPSPFLLPPVLSSLPTSSPPSAPSLPDQHPCSAPQDSVQPHGGQRTGALRKEWRGDCSVPGRAGGCVAARLEGWSLRVARGPCHPHSLF